MAEEQIRCRECSKLKQRVISLKSKNDELQSKYRNMDRHSHKLRDFLVLLKEDLWLHGRDKWVPIIESKLFVFDENTKEDK